MKKGIVLSVSVLFVALAVGLSGQVFAASKLVVAVDTPPRTMNPHGSDADANLSVMANFFDGLLQRKAPDGELVPALAESFEHPDLYTWVFHLRKGVKFHNGNPFTAADVKFSFERLANPVADAAVSTDRMSMKRIETALLLLLLLAAPAGGVVTVSLVADSGVTLVAATAPKKTAGSSKLAPRIVTTVPPTSGPLFGVTDATCGASTGGSVAPPTYL